MNKLATSVQSVKSADPDPRHAPIRAEIRRLYYAATEPHLPPPWTGRTAKKLAELLAANPKWPVDVWLRCVRNRFASDFNPTDDPIRWISELPRYVSGRLDKFGNLKRSTAEEMYAMTHATGDWLSVVYFDPSRQSAVSSQQHANPEAR
jgi:hypothetical protein